MSGLLIEGFFISSRLLICFALALSLCAQGAVFAQETAISTAAAKAYDSADLAFVHKFLSPGQYMPLSEVKPGMVGYGLTVFQGTKVERFNIRVIGVVKKVLNGHDAVLVRMSGGPLANNNVIRGMSGSPVYIDGKLVGAVSFGFDFSKEPIAGVTPIVDMLDALVPENGSKDHIAQRIEPWYAPLSNQSAKTTVSGGAPRMVPLMSPVALAGFSPRAEEFLSKRFKQFGMMVSSGASGAQDPSLAHGAQLSITPGGAVSVFLSTGDFNVVATGTTTARFGQKVLAFGHPFLQAGAVDFPLATAYVHEVLPSLFVSFKMASPVKIVGALTSDRPWSVGGQLGRTAHMIPATYTIVDHTRNLKRIYHCQVADHPDLTPELLASTVMSAIDSTHQSNGPYVARVESVVEADGIEPIRRTDRFSSNFSAHSGSGLGKFSFLADPVGSFILRTTSELTNNDFVKTSIKNVSLEITLEDGHELARLDKVYVDKPFVAPGETVDVRCVLKPYNQKEQVQTISLKVPQNMPDGQMLLGVSSGDEINAVRKRLGIIDPTPESLQQVAERILSRGRGDTIELVAGMPDQSLIVDGKKLADPPAHWARVFLSNRNTKGPAQAKGEIRVSKVCPWLVDGSHILTVEVRSAEKVLAKAPPYTMSLPSSDEAIVTTEQARKTIDSSRKSSSSSSNGSGSENKVQSGSSPAATATLKEYPHMRPAQIWRQDSDDDFRSGKIEKCTVDSWGRLGPGFEEIARRACEGDRQVWSGVCSRGFFWFAAANKIYRWAGGVSEPELVADLDCVVVPSLVADSNGVVYASTAPGGAIWAFNGKSKPELVCKTAEPIITSLCVDDKDNLYAGVAGAGKIYKIDQTHKAQEFFNSQQTHILSLFFSSFDHKLYAGCGEKGVVYAIDGGGKASAVYQSADHMVTGAVRDSRGDLYISTAAQGHLLRVLPQGEVQTIALSDAFYKLYYDPATDSVFAGDGEGDVSLCKVDPVSGQSYFLPVFHSEQEEVLTLASDDKRHLFIGTANLGTLKEFELVSSHEASYESAVRDAGKTASWIGFNVWGPLNESISGAGKQLKVETRTGDSAQPDETWSAWKETQYKDGAFAIASRPARYLQYRLYWLPGSDRAGEFLKLGKVEVSYLPSDSPPKVSSVSVKPDTPLSGKQEITVTGSDPDGDNMLLAIDISADGGKTWKQLAENLRGKHQNKSAKTSTEDGAKEAGKETSGKDGADKDKKIKSESSGSAFDAAEEKSSTEADKKKESQLQPGDDKSLSWLDDDKDAKDSDKDKDKDNKGQQADDKDKSKDDSDKDKSKDQTSDKDKKAQKSRKLKAQQVNVRPSGGQSDKSASSEPSNEEKISWSFDTSKQKDGNYILKFTLDDRLSSPDDHLQAVALRAVTVANKAPEISSFESKRNADGTAAFVIGVRDLYAPIANCTYRIDEGEPFAFSGLTNLIDGTTGKLSVSHVAVERGSHKIEIKLTDKAGNTANKTFSFK